MNDKYVIICTFHIAHLMIRKNDRFKDIVGLVAKY